MNHHYQLSHKDITVSRIKTPTWTFLLNLFFFSFIINLIQELYRERISKKTRLHCSHTIQCLSIRQKLHFTWDSQSKIYIYTFKHSSFFHGTTRMSKAKPGCLTQSSKHTNNHTQKPNLTYRSKMRSIKGKGGFSHGRSHHPA